MKTRTIKFRAWAKDAKVMHPIWSVISDEGGKYVLMQFTELLDKNGKEIYEGDIVKWSDGSYVHPSNPRIAEVRFEPELCFFAFNVDKELGGHKFGYSNFAYSDTENHLEIIGNIYENPELLTNK